MNNSIIDTFEMKWEGRFNQLSGKAKEKWGDLTDDVFEEAEGNAKKLVGKIQEKTGESMEEIQKKLSQ